MAGGDINPPAQSDAQERGSVHVLRWASAGLPWVVLAVGVTAGGWPALGTSLAGLVMLADLLALSWIAASVVGQGRPPSTVVLMMLVKFPMLGAAVFGLVAWFGAFPIVVGTLGVLVGASLGAVRWARGRTAAASALGSAT